MLSVTIAPSEWDRSSDYGLVVRETDAGPVVMWIFRMEPVRALRASGPSSRHVVVARFGYMSHSRLRPEEVYALTGVFGARGAELLSRLVGAAADTEAVLYCV